MSVFVDGHRQTIIWDYAKQMQLINLHLNPLEIDLFAQVFNAEST